MHKNLSSGDILTFSFPYIQSYVNIVQDNRHSHHISQDSVSEMKEEKTGALPNSLLLFPSENQDDSVAYGRTQGQFEEWQRK